MPIDQILILGGSSFITVFLLGFQTKNVNQSKYLAAFCTSMLIMSSNYIFITFAVKTEMIYFILISGLSGSTGIVCSIYVHDNFKKLRKKNESS